MIHSADQAKPPLFYSVRGQLLLLRSGKLNQCAAGSHKFQEVQRGTGRVEERQGELDLLDYLEKLNP